MIYKKCSTEFLRELYIKAYDRKDLTVKDKQTLNKVIKELKSRNKLPSIHNNFSLH